MKKKILIIAAGLVLLIVATFSFTGKNFLSASGNAIVNEDISFMIYKGYDYTQSLYNTCVASVNMEVEKVNSDGEATTVWEKAFDAKNLSKYPSLADAIKQNVKISDTSKKNGHLILRYNVIYNTNGHQLEIPNAILITDKNDGAISIGI